MLTNFASEGLGCTSNDDNQILEVPQSLERSLNQPPNTGMREHSSSALDASVTIGCGPDMYDQDGKF